ncbi:MAG: DUF402 domain-containing protein [Clostridia bacterium]|nr:DUF402 domain-containing protein [Clostridia bacterium]MBQ2433659.1 DUF402 domain-containing protein [Clostridia bacterium]
MIFKKKTMLRTEWRGIEERANASKIAYLPWGRARVGLLYMKRVDEPFFVKSFGKRIQITGEGYTWLQLAPETEHFWATVMFDEKGNLFQYYFDITYENHLDDIEGAWFYDMILDVVMRPGGDMVMLDRHELIDCLKSGTVSKELYDLAVMSEKQLIKDISGKETQIRKMCEELRWDLMEKLISDGKI